MVAKLRRKIYNLSKKIGDRTGVDLPYFVENGFWVGLNQTFKFLCGIALSIIFARFTTKEVYGQYNLLLSIITIISIISMPGMSVSTMKSVARGNHGVYHKAVRLSFLWSLCGIPLTGLVAVYYYYNDKPFGIALIIATFLFPLLFAPNKLSPLLQGREMFKHAAIFNSIQKILITGFVIISILVGKGELLTIFITYLVINTVINTIYFFCGLKYTLNKKTDAIWKSTGYKLTFVSFISYIYDYADKLLIGILLDPNKLAIYSIAVSMTSVLTQMVKEVIKISGPKIFKLKEEYLKPIVNKYLLKTFLLLLLLSSLVIIVLPFLITLFYTTNYNESILYAQLYMLTLPPAGIVIFLQNVLISANHENKIVNTKLILIIINLILYIVLIPSLGIIGAIISSIIYFVLNMIILLYMVNRT